MRASPTAEFAMHVGVFDRIKRPQVMKVERFQRDDDERETVEFELPQGVYRLELSVPQYHCGLEDYLVILPGLTRNVNEQLVDGIPPPAEPMLLSGTAPQSFLYSSPTFVLFDRTAACNKPVGTPLSASIKLENDQNAYYIWLYPDPAIMASGPFTLALRLGTPTGENHYIRVKVPFPQPWDGWPSTVQFNVTQGVLDTIATQPVETLLCPKLYETVVG
jgi:hypothetical protein